MQSIGAKSLRALLLIVAVALVGSGVLAFAQGTSGSLTGQISDPSGAAVVGATVTLKNVDTDSVQTATSSSTGIYLLKPVMPGNYSLAINAKGFAAYVQRGIVITANLYATQDVRLKLASAANETVTVTADAELINTTSAELGSTVNEAAISALPLDGHDPSSLVFLVPGSVDVQHHGGETIQTGFSFPTETGAGIGSSRNGSTFYMLDGVTNMDNYDLLAATFPNADATQEFKVITSNYGAQYGFAPSAVVSIATKSGTNNFHGGAFWYVRNNAMNATQWFSGQTDTLRRNQYGLFAGGPIKKDKLFVFGNYQGTKIIWNSTDTLTSTPTSAMLTGDFSGLATTADLASGTTDLNGPFKTISGKPNQLDTTLTTSACEYSASATCTNTVNVQLSPAAKYFASQGMIHAATTVSNSTTPPRIVPLFRTRTWLDALCLPAFGAPCLGSRAVMSRTAQRSLRVSQLASELPQPYAIDVSRCSSVPWPRPRALPGAETPCHRRRCDARELLPIGLPCHFPFLILPRRCSLRAIATACFWGFPLAICFLMTSPTVFPHFLRIVCTFKKNLYSGLDTRIYGAILQIEGTNRGSNTRRRLMNPPTMMRLDPDTRLRMKELAVVMGPVKPLTISDVVRECVRRVHESDIKTKEKR